MNKEIRTKLDTYPPEAQFRLLELRALIIETIATNNLGYHEGVRPILNTARH